MPWMGRSGEGKHRPRFEEMCVCERGGWGSCVLVGECSSTDEQDEYENLMHTDFSI